MIFPDDPIGHGLHMHIVAVCYAVLCCRALTADYKDGTCRLRGHCLLGRVPVAWRPENLIIILLKQTRVSLRS